MAFQQTVIRYTNENGKRVRDVVKHSNPEVNTIPFLIGEAIVYERQHDGVIAVISKDLVIEVFIEEEDPKYATFHKVRNLDY